MKTRSGKVLHQSTVQPRPQSLQAQAHQPQAHHTQPQPQPLQAQPTLSQLEITTSATGQGTHTRWVRADSASPPGRSPDAGTPAGTSLNAAIQVSTPSQPTSFGSNCNFDLPPSAYTTPSPWNPTSPPRPSPPERKPTRHASQYSTDVSPSYALPSLSLGFGGGADGTPSALDGHGHGRGQGDGDGGRQRLSVLGNAAHERLQASLSNGARADRPRGRPLVGPTGTFVQTPRPFDTTTSGVKPFKEEYYDEEGVAKAKAKGYCYPPPIPQLVLGSPTPLGSPWSSQEENFNFTLRDRVRGAAGTGRERPGSPARRRCVK